MACIAVGEIGVSGDRLVMLTTGARHIEDVLRLPVR
jgi:hypothetical protein